MSLKKFNYGKDKLTYQIAIKIANKNIETEIGLDQLEKIDASRKNVESIVGSDKTVYYNQNMVKKWINFCL